jgi:hypothetical protein
MTLPAGLAGVLVAFLVFGHFSKEAKLEDAVRQADVSLLLIDEARLKSLGSFLDDRCHHSRWWHVVPSGDNRARVCAELAAKMDYTGRVADALNMPTIGEFARQYAKEATPR